MSKASDIIKIAKAEIGTVESPKNSNLQKYGKEYGVNGTAWCCQFVWWVFNKAGASNLFYGGKKTAWVPSVRKFYTQKNKWIKRGNGSPKAGDIIIFGDRNSADSGKHIGIITSVSATTVYTIEGNTSKTGFNANGGMVAAKSYLRTNSNIAGYCSIDYEPELKEKTCMIELNQIKKGSTGEQVKTAQRLLKALGYDCGTIDGIFGNKVLKAVKAFQKAKKLTSDGIIGAYTWNKLLKG